MNNIVSISDLAAQRTNGLLNTSALTSTDKKTTSASDTFDSIYKAAVNMIDSTNNYLQQAQQAEVDYATGKLSSTHELAVIEQKASLSLQYTVAIKNQLLSAYREIMNMQF